MMRSRRGKYMAGYRVTAAAFGQRRIDRRADIFRIRASRMEAAARRRIERARNLAGHLDPLGARGRIDSRDGREQRARVRMSRGGIDFVAIGNLDDLAKV